MLDSAGTASLLELDPELGAALDDSARQAATQRLRVALLDLRADELAGKWGTGSPELAGLLLIEGALLREVETAQRITAELIGPGDLIRPFQEDGEEELPVRTRVRWRVVQPVLLGVVDGRLLQAASEWPPVLASLLARGVRRTQRLSVNLSISHMVRISDRLLLLFWHLSVHWGRVTPDGVVIDLPLRHAELGRLIGAERPSVSTALGRLAEDGLVTRLPSRGWLLGGPVPEDVGALLTRADAGRNPPG